MVALEARPGAGLDVSVNEVLCNAAIWRKDMAVTAESSLDLAANQQLQTSLRGALLRPGDEGYDAARRVWHGMIDRKPALIARCAGGADVIQAVNFAREHKLLLAVRGGGHNVTGAAVCDGGLMIDLS